VLADLLGAAELGEGELLIRLRELGLITYPSPLLGGLLGLHEVIAVEVLTRLDPTDLVLFGQAASACRAAVVAFRVSHAAGGEILEEESLEEVEEDEEEEGEVEVDEEESLEEEGEDIGVEEEEAAEEGEEEAEESLEVEEEEESLEVVFLEEGTSDQSTEGGTARLKFRVKDFVGSVERLAWAKERGCPWDHEVFAAAAFCENLDVLRWAWERRCPWNWQVCCSRLAPRGAAGDLRNWRLRVSPHPTSSYATATTLNSRWPPMKRTSTSPTRSRARAPASTPAVARPER
jgi:hypothetical protein